MQGAQSRFVSVAALGSRLYEPYWGTTIGVIKGATRTLDYGRYEGIMEESMETATGLGRGV